MAQNKDQDSYWKDLSVTWANGTSGFQYNFQESTEDSDPSSSLTGNTLETATLLLMTAHESFGFLVSTEISL